DKYRAYLNDALAYSESIDLFPGIERVYEVLGDEYRRRSLYDEAVEYSRTGLEIALTYKRRALEEGDDELYRETLYWEGEQLNNMGISRYYAGQYRLASQYFFQALKPRKERPDSMGWANTLNNIGIVHYQLRDYDKAIGYLSQGLPMHNAIGNLDGSARSLNNMGLAYQKLGNYEKAISMHHQAWAISDSIDYSPGAVNAQQNLAELYGQIGKFDSALAVVEFPRTYYSERKIWYGYAETLMQTGWALANLGNTQAGLDSLNKSLEIGLRIDSYIRVADTYEYLAKTYRLVGDYEKALEYYELGVEARDSIASQAFKQRLAELEIIHDTKEKERELLVTTLEVERQTTLRNSFIIVSILFLALGGVTLFAYRNKQKTNNRLEDRNAFLQSLMDAIPNPTYYKDRDGKYLGCNDAFFEAFGLTRDGVIGKTAYDVFDRESADSNTTDDILAFDSDGGHEYETRAVFADGDPRYVVYYKNVFRDRAGNVQGLIGVVVDVTKMRNAELTLKESERTLREANKAKDKFFSIIAHDLKSPYMAMFNLTDRLLYSYDELSDEERKKMAREIGVSARQSYDLLVNLLHWARSKTDKLTTTKERLDLRTLVEQTVGSLRSLAEEKDITLLVEIEPGTTIFADNLMISTVLRNLVGNAIKFTDRGGFVAVRAAENDQGARVSVVDNGVGMQPERLERLFEVGEIVSTSGTNGEVGSGLGLAIAKEFVENNDGFIEAKSEPNAGSSFTFFIPSHERLLESMDDDIAAQKDVAPDVPQITTVLSVSAEILPPESDLLKLREQAASGDVDAVITTLEEWAEMEEYREFAASLKTLANQLDLDGLTRVLDRRLGGDA
ncbi:MAG: tetratricopeptide repeat protein, partial [Ignavibacteriales bacterium]|nr:tetratricopeptide repeat protein [Ignavibacteriales bacterium]